MGSEIEIRRRSLPHSADRRTRDWKFEFEKKLDAFAVWEEWLRSEAVGRLLDRRFSERFGAAGKDAFLALKNSSKIIPPPLRSTGIT